MAAGRVEDGYETAFGAAEVAALRLTDAIIGDPHQLDEATRRALRSHFSEAQIVELAVGVGLFLGMSKVLINLGLEPEAMPVTVLPTPGSVPRQVSNGSDDA
jgi:alkylhydroperoxidase family enzyme